jgi:YHS domain-containing protein
MLRFILYTILFFILYYVLLYLLRNILSPKKGMSRESEPEELVQDPNCQTYIPKRSAVKKRFSGNVLYFCSQECMKRYLKRDEQAMG